jgi:hypothetical protein
LWNYVHFIIHLRIKDPTEFNGTEAIIYEQLENNDTYWFPMHKSLRMMKEQKARAKGNNDKESGF